MDIFKKCLGGYQPAQKVRAAGLYPYFIPLTNNEGTESSIGDRNLIMIGSNNYLGLTMHPQVRQAAIDAINTYGPSCSGSRFLNGTLELHLELERQLASWVGKEAALVFSTGYQVNVGTIPAIVGRNDYVITDKDDHASIVDGCKLSYGKMKRFIHNDMASLEHVLASLPEEVGKLVVVDGIFSMGGDIAPLPEIIPLCKQYGARLMVDDAHSLGILGGGRGTAAHFDMTDDVDLIMGTFSKSFASLGGFIAGDADVLDYIQHTARSLIFSASIPPANAAAALASLEVMRKEPERIARLNEIGAFMRRRYRALGFDIGATETPIIPILIRDDIKTLQTWKALFEAGVYTNPVLSPAVPPDRTLLRTSYIATHTAAQLEKVLAIMEQVGQELGII
ncbi:MAG TPA: aminotransferase class I/II-fold pyridoxal phosphate-dependent enzyme [Thermoflexia bacterium]|nr:aminotransferase class I/II-fold pyridoxal phosphate-dependent enzyme [Thermoflexia bacterium]